MPAQSFQAFEEVLLELIPDIRLEGEAQLMAKIIKKSIVAHSHVKEIAVAWRKRFQDMGFDYLGVESTLASQTEKFRRDYKELFGEFPPNM